MDTTNIDDTMGYLHVELRYQMYDHVFFYKQKLIEEISYFENLLSDEKKKNKKYIKLAGKTILSNIQSRS